MQKYKALPQSHWAVDYNTPMIRNSKLAKSQFIDVSMTKFWYWYKRLMPTSRDVIVVWFAPISHAKVNLNTH